MVRPDDFTLNGTFSLSTITQLERRRRVDNLTGLRRQLHDYAKSIGALLQLEVTNLEIVDQISQTVSRALALLEQIKIFVPILTTIDINKYRRFVKALNAWNSQEDNTPSKSLISALTMAAKNVALRPTFDPTPDEIPTNTSTPLREETDPDPEGRSFVYGYRTTGDGTPTCQSPHSYYFSRRNYPSGWCRTVRTRTR